MSKVLLALGKTLLALLGTLVAILIGILIIGFLMAGAAQYANHIAVILIVILLLCLLTGLFYSFYKEG